jgi:hypothetical protein
MGPDATDGGAGVDGGALGCSACGANQVCSDGACKDVPMHCPCPKESYCDIASNNCKIGCTDDTQCSTGRICDSDARMCHTGCRKDTECGSGKICDANLCRVGCRMDTDCKTAGDVCDMASLSCRAGCRKDTDCKMSGAICDMTSDTCRAGCRTDAGCSPGNICDTTSDTCKPGCRKTADCPKENICDTAHNKCTPGCTADTDCNTGHICDTGMCKNGCRTSATCPIGQHCDTGTKMCAAGCAGDASRCNVGEACVSYVDGTYKCGADCHGWTCNGTNWTCFATYSDGSGYDYTNSHCRLKCSVDTDCPMGQRCTEFTSEPAYAGSYAEKYCAVSCSTGGCSSAEDYLAMYGDCSCGASGACLSGGMYTCYQTSPKYGL